MKENRTGIREAVYMAPLCITTDIESEGVLCASIQQLENDGDFNWDEK